MIDYATIANTSGAFPDVVGLNSTGPGNLDGTPYIKSVIDDLWGSAQMLMDKASLTPDAVTESATASQRLEAIRRISGYPGETVPWHGDAADPSALGIRLLPLNGQGILVASYPELDASTWVGTTPNLTASAYFRADDAGGVTRNPAGIYLILPDMRGAFARGLDVSGTVDPDGASRDIGNFQDWAIYNHLHAIDYVGASYYGYFKNFPVTPGSGTAELIDAQVAGGLGQAWASDMFNSAGGSFSSIHKNTDEGRPVNVTCRWCIRY